MFTGTILLYAKPAFIVAGGILVLYVVGRSVFSFDRFWSERIEPKRRARQKEWAKANMVHIGDNRYVGRDTIQGSEYLNNPERNVDSSRTQKESDTNHSTQTGDRTG